MTVSVLVPFTPGSCAHRDRSWDWVRTRLESCFPDWQIVVGTCPGTWSKGVALADAASRADGDVLVMHDADVFTSIESLAESVEQVQAGAPWSVPHMLVHRLTPKASEQVLASDPKKATAADRARREVVRYRYPGQPGGGIAVLTRSAWDQVPVDPRFLGWGGEDEAWGIALDATIGRHHRGQAPLLHLWHPLQPTHAHNRAVLPSTQELVDRYKATQGRPDEVARILQEVVM